MIAQSGVSFVNQWFDQYWLVLVTKAAIVLIFFLLVVGLYFKGIEAYDLQLGAALVAADDVTFVHVFFINVEFRVAFRTLNHKGVSPNFINTARPMASVPRSFWLGAGVVPGPPQAQFTALG